ncbi:MAG TPA: SusF/SusE family outer membrane protein, partial [Tenuifilaceae bacterium]|nr:SusF/SusE family outer membrane protein [Tenuifilaceae bacterium]
LMAPGRVEGEGYASLLREGMYEKFLFLSAGSFNISEVAGTTTTIYGWKAGTNQTVDRLGEGDEPNGPFTFGEFENGGADFSIETAGFYHIIFDVSTGTIHYTKINHWGLIGDATDSGWSAEFEMTQEKLEKDSARWQITDLTIRATGGFKFRYNDGWKITTENDFVIFTNVGKANDSDDFMMGGGTFPYPTAGEGAYTISLKWTLESGFTFTTTRTGDVEPLPEYPETLYMIGNALNNADSDGDDTPDGWQWSLTDAPMVPVHSHPYLFWKVIWLEAGGEFKFCPVKEWNGDFGKSGEMSADSIYVKGTENIPAPTITGYYMVVVDFKENKISIEDPKIHLIGDCVGGDYSAPVAAGKFTVDNTEGILTLTKSLDAGELRMHAWHKWFGSAQTPPADWWQEELMILNNTIEFRGTGGDQERVTLTAGSYKIDLNFKTGAGSIAAQ